jgi:hypothetical protein
MSLRKRSYVLELNQCSSLGRQWALASVYAHRAYGDASMLQYAKDIYDTLASQQIIAGDSHSGGQSFVVSNTCNGSTCMPRWFLFTLSSFPDSMAGGVFTFVSHYTTNEI